VFGASGLKTLCCTDSGRISDWRTIAGSACAKLIKILRRVDGYHPVLAIKTDAPPFQNVPSDYARVSRLFIKIPSEDSGHGYSWKRGTRKANGAAKLLTVAITVHRPDWKYRVRQRKIAGLGKDFANDCER